MSFKSAQSAKIGKIFKQKRLSMSITLEEVTEKTLINIEYLKGIAKINLSTKLIMLTYRN